MKKILFVLFSLFALSACKSTPVYNVESSSVPAGITAKQVEKNILKALLQKGWEVKQNKNNVIIAEILVRTHSAKIEITFDNSQYSIRYLDSTNLKYNPSKNTIHKNYNNWIVYIDRLIKTGLIEDGYNNS